MKRVVLLLLVVGLVGSVVLQTCAEYPRPVRDILYASSHTIWWIDALRIGGRSAGAYLHRRFIQYVSSDRLDQGPETGHARLRIHEAGVVSKNSSGAQDIPDVIGD